MRKFPLDALRAARGARRVLQQVALPLVLDGGIGLVRNRFRVALPAVQVVVGDQQNVRKTRGQMVGQVLARVAQRRGADDRRGTAVVDDVRGLGRGQVRVHRYVVEPAAPRRPHDRVHVLVVLHQDRDHVALPQVPRTEVMGQAVGPGFQVIEGDDRALRVHDDGRLTGAHVVADLHVLHFTGAQLDGCQLGLDDPRRRGIRPSTALIANVVLFALCVPTAKYSSSMQPLWFAKYPSIAFLANI